MDDCLRVEFDADDVVESSASSTTFQVCRVASGAKDTRRLAIDFRRAARCSSMDCFSDLRLLSASRSRAAVSCSFSDLTATGLPFGLFDLVMGLNGSRTFSAPAIATEFALSLLVGAGVEKSMSKSSEPDFPGDLFLFLPVLRLCVSSKVGIALGGVRGTVGFSIDFGVSVGDGWCNCQQGPLDKFAAFTYLDGIPCPLFQSFQSNRTQALAS